MIYKKFNFIVATIVAVCMITTSCTESPSAQTDTSIKTNMDIITQKKIDNKKIPITVLVKNAFSINAFEKAVEEKFPQIDLIQVGNYTSDRGLVEYARRLEHDDLTDIVMTWPLNVGEEYLDERLIDMSGMTFTSKYHYSMLNNISQDGKLYYLPGPAQVRGIVYNKTLFKENGWELPKNLEEFIALCKTIEESGIRSIQLGFGNSEVLDTAFVGYSFGDCFSKPKDTQWLKLYNQRQINASSNQLLPAFQTFQMMIDEGIWKKEDLSITYADRENMLFTRQCAMVEDSVLMTRIGYSQTGTKDEFALMPFFSQGEKDSDWARLYMVCYIGMNRHLTEPQNKQKYDLTLELMEYISTIEGQQALAADTGAMYSSLNEMPPPNIPEIEALLPALNAGRYAIFPELDNSQTALRKGLADMLRGYATIEQVIKAVDEQNAIPAATKIDEEIIGNADEDFTIMDTGNFFADAMREVANTDFALFMDSGKDGRYNGSGISGRFYKGKQTIEDVIRIFPDIKSVTKGELEVVTMTGKNLLKTLEYSITVENDKTGWFYYFSGLKMIYDPIAEPGKRIIKISDENEKEILLEKNYTVAIMDGIVPEENIISKEATGIMIIDLITEAIREKGTISPSKDARFMFP